MNSYTAKCNYCGKPSIHITVYGCPKHYEEQGIRTAWTCEEHTFLVPNLCTYVIGYGLYCAARYEKYSNG